jgi:hypothetical protein
MSLIGFANNINRSSFTTKDITQLGGFARSGWGTINGNGNTGGQQGFTVDGFSLGGTGYGPQHRKWRGIQPEPLANGQN